MILSKIYGKTALILLSSVTVLFFLVALTASAANTDAVGTVTVNLLPQPSATTSTEYFAVSFSGAGTLNLDGWTVEDNIGLKHTFGAVSLNSGDSWKVCGDSALDISCDANIDTGGNTVWNNAGDTLTLKDELAATVVVVTYGVAVDDQVELDNNAVDYTPPACAPQHDAGGITNIQNTTTGDYFDTVNDALADCDTNNGDTISLLGNITISKQITLDRPVTFDGGGFEVFADFNKTGNDNNSAIGVQSDNVTIQNVNVKGKVPTIVSQLHGINVYESVNVTVSNVMATNFRSGMVVNGSTVNASNFKTAQNNWNGINVAPGSGVTDPSILNISVTSQHAEIIVPHIFIDDVTVTPVIEVNDLNHQYQYFDLGNARAYYLINDTTKPNVDVVSPATAEIVGPDFTVTGTASDNETSINEVKYTVTQIDAIGGTHVANVDSGIASGTTSWEFPVSGLTTGFYRLKAQAFDIAGNFKYDYNDIEVDADKPSATIISPLNGEVLMAGMIGVNGTSSDEQTSISEVKYTVTQVDAIGGTYVANVASGIASGTETWTFSVELLNPGFYRLKVQAFDQDGNWAYKYHDIEITVPATTTPATTTPPTTTTSSQSSTRVGSRASNITTGTPQVLGASTDTCKMYLNNYMKNGWANSSLEVTKLQLFLLQRGFLSTGFSVTHFDSATEAGVRAFQAAYADDILKPWVEAGLLPAATPTGMVYKTTKWKINDMVCPGSEVMPKI